MESKKERDTMRFTLQGARLVDAAMDIEQGDIIVEDTRIVAVGQTPHDNVEQIIDVSDCIVLPGFIDVHTHGGGGFHLHTTDASEIRSYARWVPTTGVTS